MCESNKNKFVQIHCHSSFSNLDGAGLTKKLVEKAVQYGHPALATTEHGSPAGIYQHFKECKKAGIKPILGLEFYITNDLASRVANKNRELEDRDYHQSIYIKNKAGYKNFNYLTYVSFTDGYYYKPRIDFDLLFSKHDGLMATTSCIASKINNYLTAGMNKEAEDYFLRFRKAFGDDFYGEIQFNELNDRSVHGIDQRHNNQFIIEMCKRYDVPVLIGGDVHYVEKEDQFLQDAIINSKRQAKEGEEGFQINARHLYYHDVSDYHDFNKKFGYNYDTKFLEQCFENSIAFADKVDFEFETGKYHLPKIKTDGMNSKDFLEKVTWEGIERRIEMERKHEQEIPDSIIEEYERRIPYELKVIDDLGLNDYLLIVYDIIKWEKNNDILVGPGRGSAAGSLVAYAIGITDLCPVKHGLLFERFINPTRKTMADIDWDSEMGGRDKVLDYLIETYGRDSVCSVATFGKFGPKSALKDMSRGLKKADEWDKILMRKISKLEKLDEATDLKDYFRSVRIHNNDADVQGWINNNQDTIDFSNRILGQMKTLGTHPGGIVITPEPIYNYIPVTKGSGNLITAFSEADGSSKDLSELGILKLDVLGLKGLNVLKECVNQIKVDKGIDLSERIYHLSLDDKKIIEFFATGNNFGVFQMDKSLAFTKRFKQDGGEVDSFDDIVAINAMNRPGPKEKFLPKYGYWKAIDQGKLKITPEELTAVNKERYPFEFMRKSLSPTYGALLYQEQFMQMISDVTGMTFGEADSFRRAIAWRTDNPKYHTVAQYFDRLEQSMIDKGYTKKDVETFVTYCRDFMGYSFNKCFSGDEKIYRVGQQKSMFHPTIGEMYKIKNDIEYAKTTGHKDLRKKYNRTGYGNSFSLDNRQLLIKNNIIDIRYEGIKKIYRVTTESGKTIDVTMNHKFPTSNGEKPLYDIDIDMDLIYTNAGYRHVDRTHRFNTGISNLPVAGQRGFQKLDTNFTQLMNKKKEIRSIHNGCIKCNSVKRLEIHHIDGNHGNQADENLTLLCSSCHKKEHYQTGRTKVGEKGLETNLEKIASIEFLKEDEVYDVEMAGPNHSLTTTNGIVASNSHSVVYSYISWQTLFFKVYYPAYFYAAMLNMEDDPDGIQAIIEDAKKNEIDIRKLNIARSQYLTTVEGDGAIRLGYRMVKGMGGAVKDELAALELHKCRTIDEVLQKPFKKINSTLLQSLITLGCFDEFGVDRTFIERIKDLYKEPKIEKWFTRKRAPGEEKTMPDVLAEQFEPSLVMTLVADALGADQPHVELVRALTPHIKSDDSEDPERKRVRIQKETIDKEIELMGFSVSEDDDFKSFANSMRVGGFVTVSEHLSEEAGDEPCYFKINKIFELKTKTGKPYWQLVLNDGKKDYKTKLWNQNRKIKEGALCVGVVESSDWGLTLVKCEFIK